MAIAGFDAALKLGDGATSETFTAIANVRDISGPSLAVDTVEDVHRSLTNDWVDVLPTVKRGGDVTFAISYVPTGATHKDTTGLIGELKGKSLSNYQLVFGDTSGTTFAFAAYCVGFQVENPIGDTLNASVTLRITGEPTLV